MLIYTNSITPRVEYIAKFLFPGILGVPVNLTSNIEEFKEYNGPKINYSNENIQAITIHPHTLLFEDDIRIFTPAVAWFNQLPVLFPVSQKSAMSFDPFAAAFFMITRYEEYWPLPIDKHGRAYAEQSIAFRNGFLDIPVVDYWALELKKLIINYYPTYKFPERQYKYVPTIDIDIAYAYLNRPFWRIAGAATKAFFKGNFHEINRQLKVLIKRLPDPYDTFALIRNAHEQYNLTPVFFVHVGKYGLYDKNISPAHRAMQKLIKQIQKEGNVGVHPSYRSNKDTKQIAPEINTLSDILNEPVTRSRQHFLILRFPETYQRLISYGIKDDYTMGYASHTGFRAGTCTPFSFYDLSQERETSLTVHPFQVMDGTLNQYMKLSPLEAIERIRLLNAETRKVNGTFISLWHNESLSEMRVWNGWREVFESLVSIAGKN